MEIFAITLIVSVLCNFIRIIRIIPNKLIPTIGAVLGGGLGVTFVYFNLISVDGNLLDACVTGIVSGLSATGAHQLYSQLKAASPADTSASTVNNST